MMRSETDNSGLSVEAEGGLNRVRFKYRLHCFNIFWYHKKALSTMVHQLHIRLHLNERIFV